MAHLSAREHDVVVQQIQLFKQGDDESKNVAIRDTLSEVFEKYEVPMTLFPKQVGIMPTNRDEDPMTVAGVYLRGKKVLASGMSEISRGKMWLFEDNPKTRTFDNHTRAVTSADERFAQFLPGQVRVGPANWTHTNQFMCMIADERPCDDPTIACRNGCIQREHITSNDPKIKSYIEKGMKCQVFPYWVLEEYPAVGHIFQVACNQEQQVQQGETWKQILLRINSRFCELTGKTVDDRRAAVARSILRSQPPHEEQIPSMVDFIAFFGGGNTGVYVKDLVNFCKVRDSNVTTHVAGRHFRALAGLAKEFEVTDIPALAVNAILKRLATADCVVEGVASHYTAVDISSVAQKKRKARFLEANAIMQESKKLVVENGIEEPRSSSLNGFLQTALIDCLLEKPNEDGEIVEDFTTVTKEFLKKMCGAESSEPDSSLPENRSKQFLESRSSTVENVIQYDDDGTPIAAPKAKLMEKGLAVGKLYTKGKEEEAKQVWKLLSMSDSGVCKFGAILETGEAGDETVEFGAAATASKFRPCMKEYQYLNDPTDLKNDADYEQDLACSRIKDALFVFASSVADAPAIIQTKPNRCLRATRDIRPHELKLAPLTKSVSTPRLSESTVNGLHTSGKKDTMCTLVRGNGKTSKYVLGHGPTNKKECVMYWAVTATADKGRANVVAKEFKVYLHAPSLTSLKNTKDDVLKLHCWVNPLAIKKDEMIMYYQEKQKTDKSTKEPKLTLVSRQVDAPEAKRPRTSHE